MTEKGVLERKEGTVDMKRGREEIWKGIRAREQLIRRGKQWEREKERERAGLGQGGMREETRQIVSLGQEWKEGKGSVEPEEVGRRRHVGSLDD